MKIVVVYNSRSGSALSKQELMDICDRSTLEVIDFIDCSRVNLASALKPYTKRSNQVIVACGGDGTISSVAQHVVHTRAVLAPIPGGTLNHFTKDLGVPQDIEEAFGALLRAKPRAVDTASVNGTVFLNNSSIGLYPASLRFKDQLQKRSIHKIFATAISSVRSFIAFKRYHVTIDGTDFYTPFIFVGNNDYRIEENLIGDRKKLDAGVLSVYMTVAPTRLKTLVAFAGNRSDKHYMQSWKQTEITITAKRATAHISHDGEASTTKTPLKYKIQPKSLRVLGGK